MSYIEQERQRAINLRPDMFKVPGDGMFAGKPRDFVLSEAALNLWEGIREDAVNYVENSKPKMGWWGQGDGPTGHMLSSQIACINHLYFIRQRKDLARALLQSIEPQVTSAEIVDEGYVEFEFIGHKQYLMEKCFTRGANCTSVDAAMIGSFSDRSKCLFLIEWKYTESYAVEDKYAGAPGETRKRVYDHLIIDIDSPFKLKNPSAFYYEPFYQMMRQTLLGWQLAKNFDHGCTHYRNVHVIPVGNTEINKITSPHLSGHDLSSAWLPVLVDPSLYISTSPDRLLSSLQNQFDVKSALAYLKNRYW